MPTLIEQLNTPPASVEALQHTIQALDACFLNGFVGIQSETLNALPRLFTGTPLQARLSESIEAITQNAFMEGHFVALAAARAALQGTLYDVLNAHAQGVLGRADESAATSHAMPAPTHDPLLESVRHWLMELAIAGFARVEDEAVQSFSTTLTQVRSNPATPEQGALLTGFWHEILESMPIKDAADVPLTRWCDLWSLIMLKSIGTVETPAPTEVSGTLYPIGLDLRSHARMASLIIYGVLKTEEGAYFVRTTWNSFKVAAIQGDETWLLFPEAQPLLEALSQNKAVTIENMPALPSGDLIWHADAARIGKKFAWRALVEEHFAPAKSIGIVPLQPFERHPVHLSIPVSLTDYRVEEGVLCWENGMSLPLDQARYGLAAEALSTTTGVFGLLHYDEGAWVLQPLSADDGGKLFAYAGDNGAAILKKPPKTSTVSVLRERASRLLRKKS